MSKWLIIRIYKPFKACGRETALLRGLTNHGYEPLTSPGTDDPPSMPSKKQGLVKFFTPHTTSLDNRAKLRDPEMLKVDN